jgi:carotenoid 1,2-hydratase
MTERGARHLRYGRDHFTVGPSHLRWHGDALEIDLREWSVPIPRAVRGLIRVYPRALTRFHAELDPEGRHLWAPIAPSARIEVAMASPALRWSGEAYVDSNEGEEPIGRGFMRWDWLRTVSADGSTAVVYDVQPSSGSEHVVARRFGHDGSDEDFTPAPRQSLPAAPIWRIDRQVRAEGSARVVQTLEDTPFYARSLLQMGLGGSQVTAVHETLDARRLNRPIVQAMLPWRMPRRT